MSALLLYNTYTRQKEEFTPVEENLVKMYVCGPTVYSHIHIGNARPVIFFDVVHRYFKYLGYEVQYVSNVTDVDDKIINRAIEEGVSEAEVSEKYLDFFLECNKSLNTLPIASRPKVTENIKEIVAFIQALVDKGMAYAVEGDVYFRISKIEEYGQLSGKKLEDLKIGARISENQQKENPLDFTLWKKTDKGITWESPWGQGRPGWHTECVVMIEEAFNGKIDIHGGGSDLQFPHHENEIAQSIGCQGHNLANFWMHVGRLGLGKEKMSKSIGNVINVQDLLKNVDANTFRLFMLSVHYRMPIDYTEEIMESTTREWAKIQQSHFQLFRKLDLEDAFHVQFQPLSNIESMMSRFNDAIADDFNTANAITELYNLIKEINKLLRAKADNPSLVYGYMTFQTMLYILGFNLGTKRLTSTERELFLDWEAARKARDFNKADQLRLKLSELGVI